MLSRSERVWKAEGMTTSGVTLTRESLGQAENARLQLFWKLRGHLFQHVLHDIHDIMEGLAWEDFIVFQLICSLRERWQSREACKTGEMWKKGGATERPV